ncbi:MAG: hypothetical protein HXX17_13970 [Geobacteraceae bacterium]|nr:hypothetical protein [Geobacteraceae bacterium]
MAHSDSSLTIEWTLPDLEEEKWEFFNHPAKQPFYEKYKIGWDSITANAPSARLARYPRSSEIEGTPVLLSHHTYEDYCRYLAKAKRGYRLNYSKMEDALQRDGKLTLPAPIILTSGGEALLFSGYRRLCLAWNYGMIPYVLLISA